MTISHHNRRPAKLPGMVPVDIGKASYDPSILPWTFKVNVPNGCIATILNAANEEMGRLEGNTHTHLIEMIRTIESAMRAEETRFFANAQQRAAQRRF